MEYRLPSHEELMDLAWLLDSALVVGDRRRAIELAGRLIESLGRYQKGHAGSPPEGGATTAACRHDCLTLSADVMSVLTRLRRGDAPQRVEFRHRVQTLAEGQEATSTAAV
jgi:hypothetical protein